MTDNLDNLDLQFQQMTNAEISAFNQFRKKHEVLYPPPKKQVPSLGWQFNVSMAVAVAAVILAAFRTAHAFYLAAVVQGSPLFAGIEAFVSVVAIEGAIVGAAVRNAYTKKLTSSVFSELGLWLAVLISVLAGLFQSVNIIPNEEGTPFSNFLNWTLVVFMGLGATVIAALAGDHF